jgi:nucleoside diphosphate kinase
MKNFMKLLIITSEANLFYNKSKQHEFYIKNISYLLSGMYGADHTGKENIIMTVALEMTEAMWKELSS